MDRGLNYHIINIMSLNYFIIGFSIGLLYLILFLLNCKYNFSNNDIFTGFHPNKKIGLYYVIFISLCMTIAWPWITLAGLLSIIGYIIINKKL